MYNLFGSRSLNDFISKHNVYYQRMTHISE